jgi:phospholipid-translocating ATPase
LTTLSQFVPFLKVGLLVTYVAPLVFVLIVTMLKEAVDDIQRLIRDKDMNMAKFEKATKILQKFPSGFQPICA